MCHVDSVVVQIVLFINLWKFIWSNRRGVMCLAILWSTHSLMLMCSRCLFSSLSAISWVETDLLIWQDWSGHRWYSNITWFIQGLISPDRPVPPDALAKACRSLIRGYQRIVKKCKLFLFCYQKVAIVHFNKSNLLMRCQHTFKS